MRHSACEAGVHLVNKYLVEDSGVPGLAERIQR